MTLELLHVIRDYI